MPNLMVATHGELTLHLMNSPQELWMEVAQQTWMDLSLQKGKLKEEWQNTMVSVKTLKLPRSEVSLSPNARSVDLQAVAKNTWSCIVRKQITFVHDQTTSV